MCLRMQCNGIGKQNTTTGENESQPNFDCKRMSECGTAKGTSIKSLDGNRKNARNTLPLLAGITIEHEN